ncbi:MAG: N-acetylmuramoyl-L-alanine amidase [Myxococcales bacterium]|nr:N-acetylmuramoyl-L-alanine amidase [Myxococcales bacterium]MCB9749146.1 N-acetylmuramoyl-L-alanine amidase [Myxococcales bacterium]
MPPIETNTPALSVGDAHRDVTALKHALQRNGLLERERELDDTLDPETWTALYSYAEARALAWDEEAFEQEEGGVPAAVVDALLNPDGPLPFEDDDDELIFDDYPDFATSFGDEQWPELSDIEVFDISGEHELKKGKKSPRAPEKITTIVLHQTAVKFGTTKSARAKYGERGALHRRFYNVACHVAALMNGDVLLVNGLRRYVYHGNSSNRFSIGIEIEGLYAGVAGDPKTVWGKQEPHVLTDRLTFAARRAVQYAVEEGRKLGCPIEHIQAHRNYASSRISDPGSELWSNVAVWAVAELGLKVDYSLATKGGRAIPAEWDRLGTVDYRGKPLGG